MNPWQEITRCMEIGTELVVVTVAAARGSVPGETGAKMLVSREGLLSGTVGGGRIEARALEEAGQLLDSSEATRLHCWNLQQDIGMTCGGEMTLLFERIAAKPPWHIAIFGAGHIVQALVPVLASLSCQIDVVDTRRDWLQRLPSSANITTHHLATFEAGASLLNECSFVLSITKGHGSDVPVLREVLTLFPGIPFLGVIGSASKRAALLRDLREAGINESLLEKITCPLGLPIGDNDPHEIAISVAAQLLERRDRR
ncbi:xanthine dehydrogenase accessory protein XdhC [Luteolibacter luteus]|uniref:Xanthine dehydrogenase accessory protein XdhC n=1 Tax=Luteolibacter luteus TaxID=2728835 RepID=A0A858RHL0_9BACT|nr:xanthine dehydrogenase accessory protein XdhC [Luteolibacter luteus]QJE96061.1 xanthine dehydrogenase accessory protein XdhC [Luteolibacter luteus]